MIPNSVKSFLFDPETGKDLSGVGKDVNFIDGNSRGNDDEEKEIKRANWLNRLLEIQSSFKHKQVKEGVEGAGIYDENENADDGGCKVNYDSEDEGSEVKYDRDSFSKLLVQVPWSDTKVISQLAFLCNMSYVIPSIKEKDLRKYYGLRFITSSLEKKVKAAKIKAKLDQDSTRVPVIETSKSESKKLQAKGLLSPGSKSQEEDDDMNSCRISEQLEMEGENSPLRVYNSEVAALMAAEAMTIVVRAGEKEKQETAKDLQSLHSSPCEWRFSRVNYKSNTIVLLEGTGVLVHRGIYEAAKGIYGQFMPEIMDHLTTHGHRAKLQFTGHSLGGSLSLLVNLMLLARKVVKPAAIRPVVTFGSPFVFYGGQRILDELGLDYNHVHCVMMHRDIVPRAFSCKYLNHVAVVLKRLPGSLRSYPCLLRNKLLYTPLGKLFTLQPSEKSSPPHPLIPSGNALLCFGQNTFRILHAGT
ncbi:hypothetical protein J1N35_020791 [Gossypium stocksii]|uniref:Fungal lipase-type domain-containing protein n=1 Tax=Gossypium stocksii TaxID=47602 RepID=A0A9D3VDF3_9ROSI|nr:hypothetical protein J1N35_020791 [Gossypium stocksii]